MWCTGTVASVEDRCDVESTEPDRPWTYQSLSITYLRHALLQRPLETVVLSRVPTTTRAEVLKIEVGSRRVWETEQQRF
jgi:hypothetical protein